MRPHKSTRTLWRLLGGVLRRLRWVGIEAELFLVVREGESEVVLPPDDAGVAYGFLKRESADELVTLEPGTDAETCRRWFEEGKFCYAAKRDGRLLAKVWCDLDAFNFPPNYRRLERDEAYLFALYVAPSERDRGLATLLRARCYSALRTKGRTRFYSYTDYFNGPARRFKAKLGAVDERLRLHLSIPKRASATWTLREYERQVETARSPGPPSGRIT